MLAILPIYYILICFCPPPPPPVRMSPCTYIIHNNHKNNTGYSVGVMTHVIALKGGQSGLGALEPIASVAGQRSLYRSAVFLISYILIIYHTYYYIFRCV